MANANLRQFTESSRRNETPAAMMLEGLGKSRRLFRFLRFETAAYKHNHDLVFCTRTGDKIYYDNARKDFLKILEKVGVEQSEGCFHAFRRFFAKWYSRSGANLFYLQKMLGHASLEMTRLYTDVDEEALSTQHQQASPLKRLKEK